MSYPYWTQQQQMYPQQPMMGQAGPSNGYAPLYASVQNPYALNATPYPAQPPQVPFIPPTAMIETPPAAQSQYLQTKIRPKNSLRAASTPLPLKSALKKTGAAGATPGPAVPMQLAEQGVLQRRPRNSKINQSAPTALPIQTVESLAKEEPCYHMFVTFKGDSELLLENTLENARKEIERKIFPMWPHGVETQFRGSDWILRFRNAPWNMNGPDVAVYAFLCRVSFMFDVPFGRAWELISALFTLFTERGFKFMASTKCTTAQPRLIFQSTHADRSSAFFLAYLSRGGRRVSLIDPPRHIAAAFGSRLRVFLPNQVDVSTDGNILIVETKREIGTTVKASYFLMQILKVLMDMEFHLHATVPMARGGPLGLGSRRELLVFKGVLPQ